MSADTCVIYFGLRYEIVHDEIEALEDRSDGRVAAARGVGLKYYWANLLSRDSSGFLFVGTEIGVLGPENADMVTLSPDKLLSMFDETSMKLRKANLEGGASLHVQWLNDY